MGGDSPLRGVPPVTARRGNGWRALRRRPPTPSAVPRPRRDDASPVGYQPAKRRARRRRPHHPRLAADAGCCRCHRRSGSDGADAGLRGGDDPAGARPRSASSRPTSKQPSWKPRRAPQRPTSRRAATGGDGTWTCTSGLSASRSRTATAAGPLSVQHPHEAFGDVVETASWVPDRSWRPPEPGELLLTPGRCVLDPCSTPQVDPCATSTLRFP